MVFSLQVSEYDRPLVNTNTGRKIARRASDQFLRARISENATSIRHLETDLFFQKRQLEFALRPEHTDALQQLKDRSSSQLTEKIKTRACTTDEGCCMVAETFGL